MTNFDYQYSNKSNPFAVVKWTLDGDFLAIDCEPTQAELDAMFDMLDINGWECE